MAKHRREIENPMLTTVIPLRRPSIDEYKPVKVGTRCEWCNERVYTALDDHIIIDDMYFCCDEHVTDYFIANAGGRRVHGGAC